MRGRAKASSDAAHTIAVAHVTTGRMRSDHRVLRRDHLAAPPSIDQDSREQDQPGVRSDTARRFPAHQPSPTPFRCREAHVVIMSPHRPRFGVTLVEIMVVISLVACLMLFGLPRMTRFNASNNLRSARQSVVSGLATARAAAIQRGTTGEFWMINGRVFLTANGGATMLRQPIPLDTLYKVVVNPPNALIVYNGRGMANLGGTGVTLVLTRSGATRSDTVCVNRVGLIRKTCGALS